MESQITQRAVELVKGFESFSSSAYLCPAGKWTIGYGHTEGVRPEMKIMEEEAEALLQKDLERVGHAIAPMILAELSNNQFSACVSLAFNIGVSAFLHATLLGKLNGRDFLGAADQFLLWDRIKGMPVQGLLRRRKMEREVFLALDL